MFGIGIDILHVPRLKALARRRGPARLAERILSVPEHALFAELPEGSEAKTQFLAVRYVPSPAQLALPY